jgi:hypothetical protein
MERKVDEMLAGRATAQVMKPRTIGISGAGRAMWMAAITSVVATRLTLVTPVV